MKGLRFFYVIFLSFLHSYNNKLVIGERTSIVYEGQRVPRGVIMLVNTDNLSAFYDAHDGDQRNLAKFLGLFNVYQMQRTKHQERSDAAVFEESDSQKIGFAAAGVLRAIHWANTHWSDMILTRHIRWDVNNIPEMEMLVDEIWDDIRKDTHCIDVITA